MPDYPLISRAKSSHTFRENLVDFFDSLIKQLHKSGVLYEDLALIENIHVWFVQMSSSSSRPFRHTATLVCLACCSAMCAVATEETNHAADTRALAEGE